MFDMVDSHGTPPAVHFENASQNDVRQIEPTLKNLPMKLVVPELPIDDKAADGDDQHGEVSDRLSY